MAADIVVTMMVDNPMFEKSMDAAASYGQRKAWMIAKEFNRFERQKARVAKEQSDKIARRMQKLQRVSKVASAATAAGIGLISLAMSKAAERSSDLRAQIARTQKASSGFFADIGDDLHPLIGDLDTIIDKVGRVRKGLVGRIASFGSSSTAVFNADRQLEIRKQQEGRFNDQVAAGKIENRLTGNDPDGEYRRNMRKEIAQIQDPATKARLREQLNTKLKDQQGKRERDQSRAAQRNSQRFKQAQLDSAAKRTQIEAQRRPGDIGAQNAAARAQAQAAAERSYNRIENDDSLSESQRREAQQSERVNINKELAHKLTLIQDASEQEKKRTQSLEKQAKLELESQRAQRLRLNGKEKEAQAIEVLIESEKRRDEIMARQGISEEIRSQLLAGERATLESRLASLNAAGARITAGNIGPGFAGDAATRSQVVTTKDTQRKLLDVSREHSGFLERIADNTETNTATYAS